MVLLLEETKYFRMNSREFNSSEMYHDTPENWQRKSLEGFSIPRNYGQSPEKKKSLTDSINEKLVCMATSSTSSPSPMKEGYGPRKSKSFSCGKKRTFEEFSSSQSWAKKYNKTIPEEIMLLCSNDRCDLCAVDITSSVLREQHYNGVKHEKKVNMKLGQLYPDEQDRPKKAKVEDTVKGVADALSFLKKIENQVERDPTRVTYKDAKLEEWQKIWLERWDRELPLPIVSMCRITKCDICDCSMNSGPMAKAHYEGKPHEKKLKACLELYCEKHNIEIPRRIKLEAEETFQEYCDICDLKLTSKIVANSHFAGKQHIQKKLKQMSMLATTSANEDNSGRFQIGTKFVKDEDNYKKNDIDKECEEAMKTTSDEELKEMKSFGDPVPLMSLNFSNAGVTSSICSSNWSKLQSSPKPKIDADKKDYSCDVCNLECLGSLQTYEAHINGSKHKKKLEESESANSGSFFCDICNISCQTQPVFENHIRGRPHAKRRDQAESRVEGLYL